MVSCSPWIFSPLSPKILLFSKKLLNDKILETSFPIKKFIFILVRRQTPPFLQKRLGGPRNGFLAFSQKITHFWKKLVNNKIFDRYLICNKKVMLIFHVRRLLSLKICQMRPAKQFFAVFSKNTAFFEKIVE